MSGKKIWDRVKEFETSYRHSFSHNIVDPGERRKSRAFVRWIDHEILRVRWHNFSKIAPGVYRSNHPTHQRFQTYSEMGIETIVNLRGENHFAFHKFEVESCNQLGLKLVNIPLSARRAAPRHLMLELIDNLHNIKTPFLIHCKSGADRTGLAAAIYLMECCSVPVNQAKKELSLKFYHLNFTQTGILDFILWKYQNHNSKENIEFRTWVELEYDHLQIMTEFSNLSIWKRLRL